MWMLNSIFGIEHWVECQSKLSTLSQVPLFALVYSFIYPWSLSLTLEKNEGMYACRWSEKSILQAPLRKEKLPGMSVVNSFFHVSVLRQDDWGQCCLTRCNVSWWSWKSTQLRQGQMPVFSLVKWRLALLYQLLQCLVNCFSFTSSNMFPLLDFPWVFQCERAGKSSS